MKIFVGYGFNDRDEWIPKMIFPVIRAFGDEHVTGEDLQGEQITTAVIEQIRRSDALIGFVTRRGAQPNADGKWPTHRWVTDELSQAIAMGKKVVEVREKDVDVQGGILGDRQRIDYDEAKRDKCIVDIVKTLGNWRQGGMVKLQLLPEDFFNQIKPLVQSDELKCTYCLLVDYQVSEEIPTRIIPTANGLSVRVVGVPSNALIQVKVKFRNKTWTSVFESTDSLGINMFQAGID